MSESEGLQLEQCTRVSVLALTLHNLCPPPGAAGRVYPEQTRLPSPPRTDGLSRTCQATGPDGAFWASVQSPLSASQAVSPLRLREAEGQAP